VIGGAKAVARASRFKFSESSQLFIRSRNETLSAAMCVGDPDRLLVGINR